MAVKLPHVDSHILEAKRKTGRRPRNAESGRDALLRSALKHFAVTGYEAASLRAIAEEAGVDMALVRRLFGSKAGLWAAVIEQLASDSGRRQELDMLAHGQGLGIRERMERLIDFMVDLCIALPIFPGLLLNEASTPSDCMDVFLREIVTPFNEVALPIVEEAIRRKIVVAEDPHVFFIFLMNAISLSIAAPHYVRALGDDRTEMARLMKTNAKQIFLRNGDPDASDGNGA